MLKAALQEFTLVHAMSAAQCQVANDHWTKPIDLNHKTPVGCQLTTLTSHHRHFYPCDAMLAQVFAIATCLSIRLSVTHRHCVKTKNASIIISSPSGSPTILHFLRQISSRHYKGFPCTGASNKEGWVKSAVFTARCTSVQSAVLRSHVVCLSVCL